jgi:hypothetical protein
LSLKDRSQRKRSGDGRGSRQRCGSIEISADLLVSDANGAESFLTYCDRNAESIGRISQRAKRAVCENVAVKVNVSAYAIAANGSVNRGEEEAEIELGVDSW